MLFHVLFLSLLALALVDEVEEEEVEEAEEVDEVDGDSLCNLTKVGRRWFDTGDAKSEREIDKKGFSHLTLTCLILQA